MSRRRRGGGEPDDGLELLLDVVANLFGGITLIAILIAIMTGEETHSIVEGPDEAAAYEVLRLKGDVRRAVQQYRLTSESAATAELTLQAMQADSDQAADAFLEQARKQLETELAALERDRQKLGRLKEKAHSTEAIGQTVEEEIASLRVTLRELESRVEDAEASRSPDAKLPQRGFTDAKAAVLALKGGRLYLTLGPDDQKVPSDATYRYHDTSADAEPFVEVFLRDDGGISLDGDFKSGARWAQLVDWFPSREWFVQLAVYDDSYEEFLVLRRQLALAGYQYKVFPMADDAPVVIIWTAERAFATD